MTLVQDHKSRASGGDRTRCTNRLRHSLRQTTMEHLVEFKPDTLENWSLSKDHINGRCGGDCIRFASKLLSSLRPQEWRILGELNTVRHRIDLMFKATIMENPVGIESYAMANWSY